MLSLDGTPIIVKFFYYVDFGFILLDRGTLYSEENVPPHEASLFSKFGLVDASDDEVVQRQMYNCSTKKGG